MDTPHAHSSPPSPTPSPSDAVTLAPRPWVGLGLLALAGLPLALRSHWPAALPVALTLALFALFLLIQTALLRLRFDPEALLVLRAGTEIRRFPYRSWLGWRLFLPAVPVLFYFREERSLHLLPVLFDATTLRTQLEQRLGSTPPSPPR